MKPKTKKKAKKAARRRHRVRHDTKLNAEAKKIEANWLKWLHAWGFRRVELGRGRGGDDVHLTISILGYTVHVCTYLRPGRRGKEWGLSGTLCDSEGRGLDLPDDEDVSEFGLVRFVIAAYKTVL